MKPKIAVGTVVAVAFLSIFTFAVMNKMSSGHKQAPEQAQQAQTQPIQNPAAAQPQDNQAKEKLRDNTFIEQAALTGMAEIEISKLAISKTENPKLKKYATAMVKEQADSNVKLQQVAAENRLTLPEQLDARYLGVISELEGLSGEEFDKAFINIMKKSQDTTVALFDNAAGEPTLDVDLRVFANQELPALRTKQKNTHALIETT
jgi:putative membrane protein